MKVETQILNYKHVCDELFERIIFLAHWAFLRKKYTHYITCILCACDNKTVLLLAADKLQMRIFVIFCSEMKGDGDSDGTSKAVTD